MKAKKKKQNRDENKTGRTGVAAAPAHTQANVKRILRQKKDYLKLETRNS